MDSTARRGRKTMRTLSELASQAAVIFFSWRFLRGIHEQGVTLRL
jgi:hypothetical protein